MGLANLLTIFPDEARKLGLVFALSFLIGLEREERKGEGPAGYAFGGIRTFPLIGLTGYALALLTGGNPLALAIGFVVIGSFMLASYLHKVRVFQQAGFTSEISGLLTYLLGALIHQDQFWVATALVVLAVLLLELKSGLEGLAKRVPTDQILTLAKFLLLSAVILPILPDVGYTSFGINPFETWLVVVAICAVSYGGYLLQLFAGNRNGVLSAAVLGGAYSSTVTTIALARRSRDESDGKSRLFSGAILGASGVMYLRLGILLSLFSASSQSRIMISFLVLGALALGLGVLEAGGSAGVNVDEATAPTPKNPLEIRTALLFAGLFLLMKALTGWVSTGLGAKGVYGLAIITGVTDVAPFILGIIKSAGSALPADVAASAVLIAAASNNIVKAAYAWFFAGRKTGRRAFLELALLAAAGLVPLLFLDTP